MRNTFPIPSEFSDEDKWFKYFTKKTLACTLLSGMFMVLLGNFTSLFGSRAPGLILGSIIVVFVIFITNFKIPETEYLKGAGQTIDVILIRKYLRRRAKCIYVKGYKN